MDSDNKKSLQKFYGITQYVYNASITSRRSTIIVISRRTIITTSDGRQHGQGDVITGNNVHVGSSGCDGLLGQGDAVRRRLGLGHGGDAEGGHGDPDTGQLGRQVLLHVLLGRRDDCVHIHCLGPGISNHFWFRRLSHLWRRHPSVSIPRLVVVRSSPRRLLLLLLLSHGSRRRSQHGRRRRREIVSSLHGVTASSSPGGGL